jgi:ACS family sodium-dependent inorganic phosphate cotransporter
VPVRNQTTAVGIVTAASYAGTALAFGVSPLLISRFGWQWVFYSFAGLALLWLPLWLPVRVADTTSAASAAPHAPELPSQASTSSLASSSSATAARRSGSAAGSRGLGIGPEGWALLKRREVLAICAAQYGQSWGMYGLLNWLPTFFSEYYKV